MNSNRYKINKNNHFDGIIINKKGETSGVSVLVINTSTQKKMFQVQVSILGEILLRT